MSVVPAVAIAGPRFASTSKLAAEKQLLVGMEHVNAEEAASRIAPFGRVVEVDQKSGMYLIELKGGVSADKAFESLKKAKDVRFVLPGSARFMNRSSYYSVDNHLKYLDDSDAMHGIGDGTKDDQPTLGKPESPEKADPKQEKRNDFYDAFKYYLERHVDVNGQIDRNAIFAAQAHVSAMPKATVGNYPIPQVQRGVSPQALTGAWNFIGPNNLTFPYQTYYGTPPLAGRISCLAYDPTVAGTIYAGSGGGGLWKSTNSGVTWKCISDNPIFLLPAVCSIAIDPKNHNILYVGTGDFDGFFPEYYQGIMKSTDGGTTWVNLGRNVPGIGDDAISKIVIDPNNDQLITITTGQGGYGGPFYGAGGVFRSANGGTTWSGVHVLAGNYSALDISGADVSGNVTYWAASGGYPAQIYYSRDHGVTWNKVHGPTNTIETVEGLAASKVSPGTVFILSPDSQGLFRSTDYGVTWTNLQNSNFPQGVSDPNWTQATYDYYLGTWKNPNAKAGEVLFCGLITVACSPDDGNTWSDIGQSTGGATYLHSDQHEFAFLPGNLSQVMVGNDGGAFRLTVSKWTNGFPVFTATSLNGNLGITQHYQIGPHPTNPNLILSGAQDNSSPSALGSFTNWANLYAGDGGYCGWDVPQGLLYTTYDEGGVTLYNLQYKYQRDINPGLSGQVEFIAPTVLAGDGLSLFLGGYGLNSYNFKTNAWTYGQFYLSPTASGVADAIGVTSQDPLRVYTGQSDGTVTMTDDGGVKDFYEVDGFNFSPNIYNSPLPAGAVVDAISVSPTNKNQFLVGYANTGIRHLFFGDVTAFTLPPVSTNPQHAAWTDVSGNLPDSPLTAIARDPKSPNSTWFVAMDAGVFMTTNSGASWTNVTGNMPNVTVNDLRVGGGYLYAGTFGRGIWRIAVQ
ncbi:MAG TPA: sialidase family protein [Fimbriimonadaceae bacterium]